MMSKRRFAVLLALALALGTALGVGLAELAPEATELAPVEASEEWLLMLVNRDHPIAEDYVVGELVELRGGQSVDRRIYPNLQAMFDAARSDGLELIVGSGFRTREKQQSLMDQKIADYCAEGYGDDEAVALAEAWVALPGTSEHEIGICADINAEGTTLVMATHDQIIVNKMQKRVITLDHGRMIGDTIGGWQL